MADLLSSDRDLAPSFLNSVLNQLNWAFSEFIGMIQEVSVPPRGLVLSECSCPTHGKVQNPTVRVGCAVVPWHVWELSGLGSQTFFWEGGTLLSCLHCLADPAGSRALGEELCGQPPAESVCYLL